MRSVDEILNDLQHTALNVNQSILLKELCNTLGSVQTQLKEEIIGALDEKAGGQDTIAIDDIKTIIIRAGENN